MATTKTKKKTTTKAAKTKTATKVAKAEPVAAHCHLPCFQWGVVLAGAVIACAISLVLFQFGAAVGLTTETTFDGDLDLVSWEVIATGIWVLWVQLLASLAGGYVAGYLRTPTPTYKSHVNELHDGLYGLSVWATSTVAVFAGAAIVAAFSTYVSLENGVNDAGIVTDAEQNTAVIFAFIAGGTSLLSAVAAWWSATMAGEHRVNNTDFSEAISFKH